MNANAVTKYVESNRDKFGTDYNKSLRYAQACASLPELLGDTWETSLGQMSQKGIMRTLQAGAFITSGDMKALDPATGGIAAIIATVKGDKPLNFESVRFACAGVGNEDSKLPPGVSGARLRRVFDVVKRGTIESKLSRSCGRGGMFNVLGITTKVDAHSFVVTNRSHPFLTAYLVAVSKISDAAFNLLKRDQ